MPRPASAQRVLMTAPSPDIFAPPAPPFPAQTMSIDFDGVSEAMKATGSPTLGIADVWSIGMWLKPSDVGGTHIIFEFGNGFPGQASRIIPLILSGTQLNIFWSNSANTRLNSVVFNAFVTLDTWLHLYFSWNAAGSGAVSVFKDGSPIAPDSTSLSGPIVMADSARSVTVGNATTPNISWEGPIAQLSVWRTIQDAAIASLYNGGNPNALDLNSGFGSYAGASDLAHWWRLGHQPSPNLGKDYALAGFTPTIDIEASAIGITDADRVADVP